MECMNFLFFCKFLICENPADKVKVPLWPAGKVPLSLGETDKDIPTLTPYWPDPTRFPYPCPAMIIAPGGAFQFVSYPNENADYALFLNEFGIAGFVLTYRLGPDGYLFPSQQLDVERAIKLVRYHGKQGDWDVKPDKVGIIGSSAGGMLTGLASTRFNTGDALDVVDNVSSRPDLAAFAYGAITPNPKADFEDANMVKYLLGTNDTPELRNYISNEKHVTANTPSTFLFHNRDDNTVPVENSILYSDALEEAGVDHETHLYPTGGHGVGLGLGFGKTYDPKTMPMDELLPWTADLAKFLVARGWAA